MTDLRSFSLLPVGAHASRHRDWSRRRRRAMPTENEYKGRCFCGAVEISVVGKPAAMGYCHCKSCRHWSASPVNAFTLWEPADLKVTKGAEHIGTFNRTTYSDRKWCR